MTTVSFTVVYILVCFLTYILELHQTMAATRFRQRRFTNVRFSFISILFSNKGKKSILISKMLTWHQNCLLLFQADICHTAKETLKTNATCSSSNTSLKTTMCNNKPSCNGEPLVYHCVLYNSGFAEVCAPRQNITGSFQDK